jgi:hypothetical protein
MAEKNQIRQRIAQECARIITEEGLTDYMAAKQKAVQRLRLQWNGSMPRNEEIDDALAEYHRLYRPAVQSLHIKRLRTVAVDLMQFLHNFSPRLVGTVLNGNAGPFCPITLHLFAQAPEDVLITLMDGQIPFTEQSHESLSRNRSATAHYPAVHFIFAGTNIILKLFPLDLLHSIPKKNGKEIASAALPAVRSLIDERG